MAQQSGRAAYFPGAEMSKYSNAQDPYLDPQHQVLMNRLGITDPRELEQTETVLVSVRMYELTLTPIPGQFNLEHLQRIHRHLFGDIYNWAGQLRSVDITKGETRFAHYAHISDYAPQITRALAAEDHLRGLSPHAFSQRAGHYLGELNVLHPFREGNGRAMRAFVGQLAQEAGYLIQWTNVSREANISAAINAYLGDSADLANLIERNLIDCDREAVLELARQAFSGQAILEASQPGERYRGKIIGETERYIVQQRADAPDRMVLHPRQSVSATPQVGQTVDIDYSSGKVGLLRDTDAAAKPDHELKKDHGLGR